ncbi:MAG: citrate transporter, partial [Anaerotignum sp.]|nr:citrate transporter [Anaerotignum sp.]
ILLVIVFVTVLLFDRSALKEPDYALLATFVCFFVFIGNMQRIEAVCRILDQIIAGRELLTAIAASQVISNVPAAVLLSEFTTRYDLLIAGVNIGGLGTLIASMASLISYKYYAQAEGARKGRYMLYFTAMNILFAVILLAVNLFIPYLPEVHLADFF